MLVGTRQVNFLRSENYSDAFVYFRSCCSFLVLVGLCCLGVLCLKCPVKVIENIMRMSTAKIKKINLHSDIIIFLIFQIFDFLRSFWHKNLKLPKIPKKSN